MDALLQATYKVVEDERESVERFSTPNVESSIRCRGTEISVRLGRILRRNAGCADALVRS